MFKSHEMFHEFQYPLPVTQFWALCELCFGLEVGKSVGWLDQQTEQVAC